MTGEVPDMAMDADHTIPIRIGPFNAWIEQSVDQPPLREWLHDVEQAVRADTADVLASGRNMTVRVPGPTASGHRDVVVKAFSRPSALRRITRNWRGTKGLRTWTAATHLWGHGVGTPAPVALLQRADPAGRFSEFFVSVFMDKTVSFKDELARLFHETPECSLFMSLLTTVAHAVRKMHDAGFVHNDLGNQNILLRRAGPSTWQDVAFVDLNRGWVRDSLSDRERGRDLSRVDLPSDLLRVFREMYWAPDVPPSVFLEAERRARRRYALHCATRAVRHPIREARRSVADAERDALSEKDMWIWDSRSGQAISILVSRDRHRYYPLGRHPAQVAATAVAGPALWGSYRRLCAEAFSAPVAMKDRISVALSPDRDRAPEEMAALSELGKPPVHLRFYHHETRERWDYLSDTVRSLRSDGRDVSVSLVQDRAAVLDPARWVAFVERTVGAVADDVCFMEVGHAINRVKWGLWGLDEYRRLVAPIGDLASSFPQLRLTGPAAIDFEYPFVLAALKRLPRNLSLWALSHHLYVDRRGAPENRQGPFASLEKFALARAIARHAPNCDDRLIVSEVNWPLLGTGVYSPVGSPYESPGERHNDPSVTEDLYADYMIRYLLIALCSGLVEQVVWWQLAAHGYGLVDDRDDAGWRRRPAHTALRVFLDLVGNATFIAKRSDGFACVDPGRAHAFVFDAGDGNQLCIAYLETGEGRYVPPFSAGSAVDLLGRPMPVEADGGVPVCARPVYLLT